MTAATPPKLPLLQVPGLAQFGAVAPVCGPDGCEAPEATKPAGTPAAAAD